MAHLYSCGCIHGEPYCPEHGRYTVANNDDYKTLYDGHRPKRRTIRDKVEIYQCDDPDMLPYGPIATDLIVVERPYNVVEELQNFLGSATTNLLLEGIPIKIGKHDLQAPELSLTSGKNMHCFTMLNEYQTDTDGFVYDWSTNSTFYGSNKFAQIERTYRGNGCQFEKWVIQVLKPRRILHLNAYTQRWMKAAVETDTKYIAQTVNPIAYNLLKSSTELEKILLSDQGNLYGKK